VDTALFTYLNALPAQAPVLGRVAESVAQDAIFLYALLLLWLWVRAGRATDGGRRILLLAVVAAVLSLGINAALNVRMPRPRIGLRRCVGARRRTHRHRPGDGRDSRPVGHRGRHGGRRRLRGGGHRRRLG
jgi:hypothetical protein